MTRQIIRSRSNPFSKGRVITFMWKSLPSVAAAAALLFAPVLHASDIVYPGGGTLTQVVDGGGANTIITLANLDTVIAAYTLSFYADNGTPMTLSTTAGTGSSLTGALPAHGSLIIQTNGGGATVISGYAVLTTGQFAQNSLGLVTSVGNQIAGSAVFSLGLASGVFAQASCPLDTGQDYIFMLPFDETGGATSARTGVALANSVADGAAQTNGANQTAYINVSFFDDSGNAIPVPALQVPVEILPYGQHESFMLDDKYPQIIGKKGTAVFTGADSSGTNPYIIKVLGLRATNTTFTSITPIVPCNPQVYNTGQYVGCGN